jgi:ribosomal protein L13
MKKMNRSSSLLSRANKQKRNYYQHSLHYDCVDQSHSGQMEEKKRKEKYNKKIIRTDITVIFQ